MRLSMFRTVRRVLEITLALACCPLWLASARLPAQSAAPTKAATVRGVVTDSIARAPLASALVQLVSAEGSERFAQTITSDSAGGYAFERVPDGRYTIGFFHPMLDSLGLEPTLRAVEVARQRDVRVDLAIPSAERLRETVCGPANVGDEGALIFGTVRNASTNAPVSGAEVSSTWTEITFARAGTTRRVPRTAVTTKENGWYAICRAPTTGILSLEAHMGADSTDVLELQVAQAVALRRDLYVGVAGPARAGDGTLRGRITSEAAGKPLGSAQVSIVNGPMTRTNDRGEFLLTNAPRGTRALEIKAVGHAPGKRIVDVVDSAPSIDVALVTLKSVLDTVRVLAQRNGKQNFIEFNDRRRTGQGHYITEEDIARRRPVAMADIFHSIPGVYIEVPQPDDFVSVFAGAARSETPAIQEPQLLMRGVFTRRCYPTLVLNGQFVSGITAYELDALVKPREILGVEVYSGSASPPQFVTAMSGCGSVVIWTK